METSNPVFAPGVRMMTDEILKLHFFHAGEYKNIFFPHSHKVGRISCFVFLFCKLITLHYITWLKFYIINTILKYIVYKHIAPDMAC